MTRLPKIDIVSATKRHSASLFLFHGSGIYIYVHVYVVMSLNNINIYYK